MANPTIEELQNKEQFELIARLNHREIKEFVLEQLSHNGKIVRSYMVYQIVMIIVGIFFFIRSVTLYVQDYASPLYYSLAALLFCFSLLIILHELIHGIALKIVGAPHVNFGGYFKKFIFYAEADRFVINKKQFVFIALAPLLVIKLVTIIGILLLLFSPVFYFLILVMCAHSLFCAGDIGLLTIFLRDKNSDVFTYDIKSDKTSFYFRKK